MPDYASLNEFLGPRGSAYLCMRVEDCSAPVASCSERSRCDRCREPTWLDPKSYALASELGEARKVCSRCWAQLLGIPEGEL